MRVSGQHVGNTEEVGGRGPHRHQHIHIGAAIAQGRVGTAVKRPAGDELYRRCQYQLYGGVHKKLADTGHNPQRMQQHCQQQRQGQQRRQQQS